MLDVTTVDTLARGEQLTDWLESQRERSVPVSEGQNSCVWLVGRKDVTVDGTLAFDGQVGHGSLSDRTEVIVTGVLALDGHGPSWKTVEMLVCLKVFKMAVDADAGMVTVAGAGQSRDAVALLLEAHAIVERLET